MRPAQGKKSIRKQPLKHQLNIRVFWVEKERDRSSDICRMEGKAQVTD